MKYTKYSTYSYNLHIIKTDKFKTITMKVNFKRKLEKSEITYRNMLVNILGESTKEYPNKRLLDIACEDLYSLRYCVSSYISGNYNIMGFDITFLNEKYTESGYLDKSVKFLANMIFKPNTEKKRNIVSFKEDNYNMALNYLKDNIETLKEDTFNYSKIRMYENMEPDSKISYRGMGYLEDLEELTSKKLYDYYENVLNSDIIDIFVIGDVNTTSIKKSIEKNFSFLKTLKKPTESHFLEPAHKRLIPQNIKEAMDVNQSKLCIGCKIDHMTDFEKRYVLNVYSYILGGGTNSKLFQEVREKNSLCYYIGTSSQPLTSTLMIYAGINKDDYKKANTLIKQEFTNMKKGKFLDSDIIEAKITYINSLKEMEDSPISLINLYAGIEYLGGHTIDERFININKVTKKDVMKLASKIHMDTIYLLEGDKNDK